MFMTFVKILSSFSILLFLVACAAEQEVYKEEPVEQLYNVALTALEAGEYEASAKAFTEVDRQHPYSVWATKAQLMSGFSYYENNDYDEAIIALDRFIAIHPTNKDIPYAYYLKALCYYEQISDIGRDQKMTELALKALREITARFPNTKYSRDSIIKIDLTLDHLAGKEMEIGRYYGIQGLHLGAINRYKKVIDKFQTTTHVPEALHRLTESYLALGLTEPAKKTASILGHNFPGSEWYIDAYELVEGKKIRKKNKDGRWYWPFDKTVEKKPIRKKPEDRLISKETKDGPWYWPFD
jgi:outer membrane protein assembly factor BamD